MEEMAVQGADPRLTAGRHGGEAEHLHAGEQSGQILGGEGPAGMHDVAQMVGGPRVRPIKQKLQRGDLFGVLQHDHNVARPARPVTAPWTGKRPTNTPGRRPVVRQ
jgi:hypothetical protein